VKISAADVWQIKHQQMILNRWKQI